MNDTTTPIPEKLLKRKVLPATPVLTTAHSIIPSPATAPIPNERTADAATRPFVFVSTLASKGGGIPTSPKLLGISDAFQPAIGVYILPSATARGKSVLSLALVAWANDMKVPASYIGCFEPRSPDITVNGALRFRRPQQFKTDATEVIQSTPAPKLIVFDSATLPMKANAENFAYQATFPGGSQPSDRGFLDDMTILARASNSCIILILNSTLVPYVADLQGAVEGQLTLVSIKQFQIQDRTAYSGRQLRRIDIPMQYVQAALTAFNLGQFRSGAGSSSDRGFLGL